MPPTEQQPIDIGTLSPQQLARIRDTLEADIQNLNQSCVSLQKAAGEFGRAGKAIELLAQQKEGQPMLVPMTGSMYVAGSLASADTVLLDIGTGFYIEKSTDDGVDYCKRKVGMLAENLEKYSQLAKGKQDMLMYVRSVLEQKVQPSSR